MTGALAVFGAFCIVAMCATFLGGSAVAIVHLLRDRRAKRAACRDRHPAGRFHPGGMVRRAAWLDEIAEEDVARREADRMFAELEAWRRGE